MSMMTTKYKLAVWLVLILIFIGNISCEDPTDATVASRATDNKMSVQKNSGSLATSTLPYQFLFEETVEGATPFSTANDWDVGNWDYALQFVPDPFFRGVKSARFEIRDDQALVADGKRSEITIVKGADGEIGKNTWYSFAVYFPSVGYEYDTEREVVNQWYQNGTPATSLRTQKDKLILETGNTSSSRIQITIASLAKDKWHEVVMHFIHSYGSDGLIELWYDGAKKITRTGGNMYNDVLPKWKIGLYKSAFKYGTSLVHKRIIYFDNVRVGDQNATYELMKPSN
jgi:hypothetical protein